MGGIAVAKTGHIVIAGVSTAKHDEPAVLVFINPINRRVVLQLPVELRKHRRARLQPKIGQPVRGQFPATTTKAAPACTEWTKPANQAAPACVAAKIADVHQPTALAFGLRWFSVCHIARCRRRNRNWRRSSNIPAISNAVILTLQASLLRLRVSARSRGRKYPDRLDHGSSTFNPDPRLKSAFIRVSSVCPAVKQP